MQSGDKLTQRKIFIVKITKFILFSLQFIFLTLTELAKLLKAQKGKVRQSVPTQTGVSTVLRYLCIQRLIQVCSSMSI